MEVVRIAALAFQANMNVWPPDAARGVVPTGLDEFLPADFDPVKSDYQLDFDNWGGSPFEIGITLVTSDANLVLTLLDMLPAPKWNSGDKYSWVIE